MYLYAHNKLAELLNDPTVSLGRVAVAAGMSWNGINKLAKGKVTPNADTLAKLATVFKKSPEYFFELDCNCSDIKEPA